MSRMEHKSFSPQTEATAKKRLHNGIEIYQNNEGETEFLYNEIFQKEMYFKHGITLPDHGTVMDVGANIGMFTLYVSSKSNCRVYAFEPLPPTFELLKMNTSSLPRVTTVNVGLSNEIKEAEFAYFPTMSTDSVQIKYRENHDQDLRYGLINHYRDDFADPRMLNRFVDHLMSPKLLNEQIHRCKLTTISEMIRYYDLNPIDLLKIDVEKVSSRCWKASIRKIGAKSGKLSWRYTDWMKSRSAGSRTSSEPTASMSRLITTKI